MAVAGWEPEINFLDHPALFTHLSNYARNFLDEQKTEQVPLIIDYLYGDAKVELLDEGTKQTVIAAAFMVISRAAESILEARSQRVRLTLLCTDAPHLSHENGHPIDPAGEGYKEVLDWMKSFGVPAAALAYIEGTPTLFVPDKRTRPRG